MTAILQALFDALPASLFQFFVSIIVVMLILALMLVLKMRAYPPIKGIPAVEVKPHWFFGHLLYLRDNIHRIHDWRQDTIDKLGKVFTLGAMSYNVAVISDPRDVEWVLKTNFNNYVKGMAFRRSFTELLGDGIFNSDGETWQRTRKVASHIFAMKVMKEDMSRVFSEHGHVFCSVIENNVGKSSFDIQKLFFSYTFDAITELAFGVKTDALLHPSHELQEKFDEVQTMMSNRSLKNPFFKYFPFNLTSFERRLKRLAEEIRGHCNDIIRTRRDNNMIHGRYPDLLSVFASYAEEHNETMDDKEVVDLIVNFMLAGRDTTACLLSWLVYEVCRHPEVEKRMVEELNSVCVTGVPSYDECHDLVYTECVIYETLRLHPSVPADVKLSVNADTLPSGYKIPPKTVMVYPVINMGKDTDIWGEDAYDFRPERWLVDSRKVLKPSPFQYPVFNAGPRTCLGRYMAVLEAKTLTSMLYTKYRLQMDENQSGQYSRGLTMRLKHPLMVKVSKR